MPHRVPFSFYLKLPEYSKHVLSARNSIFKSGGTNRNPMARTCVYNEEGSKMWGPFGPPTSKIGGPFGQSGRQWPLGPREFRALCFE